MRGFLRRLHKLACYRAENHPVFYNAVMKSSEMKIGLPKWSMVLIYTMIVVFLGLIAYGVLTTDYEFVKVGSQIPDFSVTSISGENIEISSLPQDLRVIHFWASWCVTCKDEAPALEEAWEQYRGGQEVLFLGVATSDNDQDARGFISDMGVTYPNTLDPDGQIADLFTAMAIPETFFLDKQGVVLYRQVGAFRNSQQIIQIIDKLLEEPGK